MLLYLAIIWLLSGLLTGITSFGGNMLAIPLMALVYPARSSILIGCLAGWAMGLAITLLYRKSIIWRDLFPLFGGFVCGMPVGVFFLKIASEKALLLAASGMVFGFLLWQWLAPRIKAQARDGLCLATLLGFIGGLMLGAMGMGGPPIAFYALLRNWSKNESLGTLNALFAIFMLFLTPMQWHAGLLNLDLLGESLWGALFASIGILASVPIVERVNQKLFHALLIIMIGLSGVMLLARGIMA